VRFLRVCQSLRARELESSRELESAREVPGILFITIEIPCFFFMRQAEALPSGAFVFFVCARRWQSRFRVRWNSALRIQ